MPAPVAAARVPAGLRHRTRLWTVLAGLAIAVAGCLAHGRSLEAGLLFDDHDIVGDPTLVTDAGGVHWRRALAEGWWGPAPDRDRLWRPVTQVSIALQRAAGQGPRALHTVNLGLHVAVALLVALWIRRLAGPAAAVVAGLLFAVHPLAGEAVTFVVGRADLLATGFVLTALIGVDLSLEAGRSRAAALCGTALAAAGAMLSKESGFALPLLAVPLILVRARSGGVPRARQIAALVAVTVPALPILAARSAVLGGLVRPALPPFWNNPIAHAGPVEGRLEAARLLMRGLRLFLWPSPLSPDYSYAAITVPPVDLTAILSTLAGLGAVGVVAWLLRRRPWALLGGVIFFLAQVPTSNLLFPIGTVFAERLLYLPMAGLGLLLGDLVGAALGSRRAAPAVLLSLAAVLGSAALLSRSRGDDFVSDLTLWRAATEAQPDSAKAHYNLGRSWSAAGEDGRAVGEYEAVLRLAPDHLETLNNLGAALLRLGEPGRALRVLDRGVALDAGRAILAFNRALALAALGRHPEARAEAERAVGLDPTLASRLRPLMSAADAPPPHAPAPGD